MNFKRGAFRFVILTKSYAIKVPVLWAEWGLLKYSWNPISFFRYNRGVFKVGLTANRREVKLSGRNKLYCPVLKSYFNGLILVMPKCTPLKERKGKMERYLFPKEWEPFKNLNKKHMEDKRDNFGWLNGKIVCFDYGGWEHISDIGRSKKK